MKLRSVLQECTFDNEFKRSPLVYQVWWIPLLLVYWVLIMRALRFDMTRCWSNITCLLNQQFFFLVDSCYTVCWSSCVTEKIIWTAHWDLGEISENTSPSMHFLLLWEILLNSFIFFPCCSSLPLVLWMKSGWLNLSLQCLLDMLKIKHRLVLESLK